MRDKNGLSPNQKVEKVAEIFRVFLRQKQQHVLSEEGGVIKENWALVWMSDGWQCPPLRTRGGDRFGSGQPSGQLACPGCSPSFNTWVSNTQWGQAWCWTRDTKRICPLGAHGPRGTRKPDTLHPECSDQVHWQRAQVHSGPEGRKIRKGKVSDTSHT